MHNWDKKLGDNPRRRDAHMRQNARTAHAAWSEIVNAIADTDQNETALMVPPDFICRISKKVMKDPVVVASGITYERANIQAWLDKGNSRCPVTGARLAHLQLVPNLTLKHLISSWMTFHSGPFRAPSITPSTIPSSTFSSTFDSFASCPNLRGNSTDTQHHNSSSSLPKLLQNVEFLGLSSSSIDSFTQNSPDNLSNSFSDSFFEGKSDMNVHPQPQSGNSECSDHDSQPASVPERQGKESSKLKKMLMDRLRQKSDSPLPGAAYIASRINTLVTRMQSVSIEKQRASVTELRMLAKHDDDNRLMIVNAGALVPLLNLIQSKDEATEQEATTALLNLSLNQTVRDEAVKVGAIELLVRTVKEGMSAVAMENAAVALTNLSCSEENKTKIGKAGAIPALLELLHSGSLRGKKDAAAALYSLSSIDENKKRIVRGGATRLLVNFMLDEEGESSMVDKAIAILRNLVSVEEGRVAFVEEGGIKYLLQVMKTGSRRSKSWGVTILYQLCTNSTKHRSLVLQQEPLPLLMDLSKSGNSGVKTEIDDLLSVLIGPVHSN